MLYTHLHKKKEYKPKTKMDEVIQYRTLQDHSTLLKENKKNRRQKRLKILFHILFSAQLLKSRTHLGHKPLNEYKIPESDGWNHNLTACFLGTRNKIAIINAKYTLKTMMKAFLLIKSLLDCRKHILIINTNPQFIDFLDKTNRQADVGPLKKKPERVEKYNIISRFFKTAQRQNLNLKKLRSTESSFQFAAAKTTFSKGHVFKKKNASKNSLQLLKMGIKKTRLSSPSTCNKKAIFYAKNKQSPLFHLFCNHLSKVKKNAKKKGEVEQKNVKKVFHLQDTIFQKKEGTTLINGFKKGVKKQKFLFKTFPSKKNTSVRPSFQNIHKNKVLVTSFIHNEGVAEQKKIQNIHKNEVFVTPFIPKENLKENPKGETLWQGGRLHSKKKVVSGFKNSSKKERPLQQMKSNFLLDGKLNLQNKIKTKSSKQLSEFEKKAEFLLQKSVLFQQKKKNVTLKKLKYSDIRPFKVSTSTHRWVEGLLTNWKQLSKSVKRFSKFSTEYEELIYNNDLLCPPYKKATLWFQGFVRINKNQLPFEKKPDLIFVVNPGGDSKGNHNILQEGFKSEIPIIGIIDSNTEYSKIRYPILSNGSSKDFTLFCLKKIIQLASFYGKKVQKKVQKKKPVRDFFIRSQTPPRKGSLYKTPSGSFPTMTTVNSFF